MEIAANMPLAVAIDSNDLARNYSVLIKRIDRAQPMIAICNDHFAVLGISDQQQR